MANEILEDRELAALALAVRHKAKAIEALATAAAARKARGADTTGIEESLNLEDMTRAGYQRALDHRFRELSKAFVSRGPR